MPDLLNSIPVRTLPDHMTEFEFYSPDAEKFEIVEKWLQDLTHGQQKLAVRDYHGWPRDCFFKIDTRFAVAVFEQLLLWNKGGDERVVFGCRFHHYF